MRLHEFTNPLQGTGTGKQSPVGSTTNNPAPKPKKKLPAKKPTTSQGHLVLPK